MAYTWLDVHVYKNNTFIGSITTNASTHKQMRAEINEEFGSANWTRYDAT